MHFSVSRRLLEHASTPAAVQGAAIYLQPSAETQDLNSDALLQLIPAEAAAQTVSCYRLYAAFYESSAPYPTACDALLPMPYPPISASKLQALLSLPGAAAAATESVPKHDISPASNAGAARRLSSVISSGNGGAHDSLADAPNGPSALAPADAVPCLGVACSGPSSASKTTLADLQLDVELFWDALCFAETADRITDSEAQTWHYDTITAARILATVRSTLAC
jgi:hypothetical protein